MDMFTLGVCAPTQTGAVLLGIQKLTNKKAKTVLCSVIKHARK